MQSASCWQPNKEKHVNDHNLENHMLSPQFYHLGWIIYTKVQESYATPNMVLQQITATMSFNRTVMTYALSYMGVHVDF